MGFDRLAAHDAQALLRYSWFVSAPVLALAFLGLGVFIWRADRRDLLATSVLLAFSFFYFYKIRVFNDYFFAMRRYVPVTLPFTFVLAALGVVTVWRQSRRSRIVAAGIGLAAL